MSNKLDDPKEIQKFLVQLDNIEKLYRSHDKFRDEIYIDKGEVLCTSPNNINSPYMIDCNILDVTKTKEVYDFFINNSFALDTKEYFEFRKNKKDKINLIEIEDNILTLKRTSGEIYSFDFINSKDIIEGNNKLKDNINNIFSEKELDYIELDESDIERVKKVNEPFLLRMKDKVVIENDMYKALHEDSDEYKIYMLPKYINKGIDFRKLKTKNVVSEVSVSLRKSEINKELLLFIIKVKNETLEIKQSFYTLNI